MKRNSSADLNGNDKSGREHRLEINGVLPGTSYKSFKAFHLKHPEYYDRLLDYLRLVIDPESNRSVNALEIWDSFIVSLGGPAIQFKLGYPSSWVTDQSEINLLREHFNG